jgi:hypothetical protein
MSNKLFFINIHTEDINCLDSGIIVRVGESRDISHVLHTVITRSCDDIIAKIQSNSLRIGDGVNAYSKLESERIITSLGTFFSAPQEICLQGGNTFDRPEFPQKYQQYFDKTLGKAIWHDGNVWVDAMGQTA